MPVTVVEVEPPRRIRSRLGGGIFKGPTEVRFESDGGGTTITQWFEPESLGPMIAAWLFSQRSWKGSFRGELNTFKRVAERETRTAPS